MPARGGRGLRGRGHFLLEEPGPRSLAFLLSTAETPLAPLLSAGQHAGLASPLESHAHIPAIYTIYSIRSLYKDIYIYTLTSILCTHGGPRTRSPARGAVRGPAPASGQRAGCSGRDGGPASAQRGSGPLGGAGVTQPVLGPAPTSPQEGFVWLSPLLPHTKGRTCVARCPAPSRSRAGRGAGEFKDRAPVLGEGRR